MGMAFFDWDGVLDDVEEGTRNPASGSQISTDVN